MLNLLEAEQFGSHAGESSTERSDRYLRLLQKISRSIHLIKGNAAMLRLSYFEDLANRLEEKIATVRGGSALSWRTIFADHDRFGLASGPDWHDPRFD